MQHAKGVAQLLDYEAQLAELDADTTDEQRQKLVDQRNAAIPMLQSAARRAPRNAAYLSDLAAAFIAKRDFQQAVDVCNRALQIDSRSPDARFNLAKAKDLLAVTPAVQTEAIKAYNAYLEVDHSSRWADEARDRIRSLQEELKPLP
jgi:tetratricopeptide (TPR) repeat protein